LAEGSSKPTVFVRNATGLVREVGAWSSFMAVFGLVTSGVPILMISLLYTAPGANWPLAFLVAFIPTLLMAGLFTIIGASMPRSGGDYIFVTRGLNPFVGFVNNWGVTIAYILNLGIFSFFASSYIGYLFGGLGAFYHDTGLAGIGTYITQLGPTFALAIILIAISTLIAMTRPRYAWGFIFYAGIVTVVTSVIMNIALAGINPSGFATAYNSFMGNQTAYSNVISTGGVRPATGWLATAAALPFTWFAYTWYNLPTSWSGEMKNVKKSMPIAILVTMIVIAVYYISFAYVAINAFGQSFLENWSSLAVSGKTPILGVGNFIPFFALLMYRNVPLYVIMFMALWLQNIIAFPALIVSQTRYIFAWSFDRVIPERLATVNERFHTPLLATVLVAIGGVIGAGLIAFLPSSGEFASLSFTIFSFGFIIPGIAAAVFPYRKKELYETAFIAKKKFLLPLLSWLGIGSAVYLVYSTYLAHQGGSLPIDWLMTTFYGVVYVAGTLVFLAGYLKNKSRGIPLELAFREIPPE
jgi:amino acid transporter